MLDCCYIYFHCCYNSGGDSSSSRISKTCNYSDNENNNYDADDDINDNNSRSNNDTIYNDNDNKYQYSNIIIKRII